MAEYCCFNHFCIEDTKPSQSQSVGSGRRGRAAGEPGHARQSCRWPAPCCSSTASETQTTKPPQTNRKGRPQPQVTTHGAHGFSFGISRHLNKRIFSKERTAGLIYCKPTPEIITFLCQCKLDFLTDFLIIQVYFLLRRPKRPFYAKIKVIFIKCETFFRQRIVSEHNLCLDTEFLSSSLRNPEGNLL